MLVELYKIKGPGIKKGWSSTPNASNEVSVVVATSDGEVYNSGPGVQGSEQTTRQEQGRPEISTKK